LPSKSIFIALALFCFSALPAQAERYTVRVLAVSDGDSMLVDHNGKKEKLIMYGIDCPESGQDFGPQAKKFTDTCCFKKDVVVDVRNTDKYGRVVAEVYLTDGADLNQELVRRGLAWWSDKFAPGDLKLKELQADAKAKNKGLWTAPNPIPPWIFRNGDKAVQATIVTGK